MTDLGTIGDDNFSRAFGINAKGQVVGQWLFDGEKTTASHAFLWEAGGPITDLNTLISNRTDQYLTEANFITDRGWIIANGPLPNGDLRAVILIPQDGDHDLSSISNAPVGSSVTLQKNGVLTPQMQAAVKSRIAQRNRLDAVRHPAVHHTPRNPQ